jgi:hypothetical protein
MYINDNPKAVTTTDNNTSLSCIVGDLTQQQKDLARLISQMPYGYKDSIVRPLLRDVIIYFQKNNINPENLPAAVITVLTLQSVRLQNPMAIILKSDDPMIVQQLLIVCKQVTSASMFIEVQQLPFEQLYQNQDEFKNKVLICTSAKGCKNAWSDIDNLILDRASYRQETYKGKMGSGFKEFNIQYPIGFIGVEIGDEKFDLTAPSIFKINLTASGNQNQIALSKNIIFHQSQNNRSPETLTVKRMLERLLPSNINILYQNQILSDVMKQRPEKLLLKFKSIISLINLLTITNNPPPFTSEEAIGYCIGHAPGDLCIEPNSKPALVATKVEYAQMVQLLKDIIPIKEEHYSRNQVIIFEAVKDKNLTALKNAFIDQENYIEVLTALYQNHYAWAKIEHVFKIANNKSKNGRYISIQNINDELNRLNRLGLISKRKLPQSSDAGYYINVMNIGKHITFQKSSEIADPKFNMEPVQVVNPLTGKIQTI